VRCGAAAVRRGRVRSDAVRCRAARSGAMRCGSLYCRPGAVSGMGCGADNGWVRCLADMKA
jgi:hypothetical protein